MFKRLLPKSDNFFDYFEKHASLIVQSAIQLRLLVTSDNSEIPAYAIQIKTLEHEADDVTHKCIEALHKTFITPFDRDDIYQLSYQLDDIIDFINATATTIVMYKIKEMKSEMIEFVKILEKAAHELEKIVLEFRDRKNIDELRNLFSTIKEFENDSDNLLRKALSHLFDSEPDTRNIIKWKEIFTNMEEAINKCERVSNIIEGVILELS